jgi:ABC-type nitrate/sulfonate/bicarbonate transport system substrate-binding protein
MGAAAAALLVALAFARPGYAEPVKVGNPEGSAFMFAPIDVGIQAGIFKKNGVEVEKVNFAGGAKLVQGLASGAADLSTGGCTEFGFIARGAPQKAVAEMAGPPVDLALIVRNDGSIKSTADLKGKKIGDTTAGSLTDWLAREFARRQGWGEDGVEHVHVGGMSSEIAALTTKQVDAIVGPTEIGTKLEQEGRAKILVTFGPVMPDFVTHFIYATDKMIASRPDDLRKFLKGWFETIAWMRAHKDESVKIISAVTKVPPDLTAKAYDVQMPALSNNGKFDMKAFEVQKKQFIEPELLAKLKGNDALMNDKFLP